MASPVDRSELHPSHAAIVSVIETTIGGTMLEAHDGIHGVVVRIRLQPQPHQRTYRFNADEFRLIAGIPGMRWVEVDESMLSVALTHASEMETPSHWGA